jgi:hypothetical protein
VFYKEENLVFCPIVLLQALAFADNAFRADLSKLEEIYNLEIPVERDCIRLR